MRRMPQLLVFLLLTSAGPVAAQLTVQGLRDLAFGRVVPGLANAVAPNDPIRSGQWEFATSIGTKVKLSFTLPANLNGPAGATMPISFANNDGIVVGTASTSVPTTFNPKANTVFQMDSNRILVFLGGKVAPAGNQPAGNYTNTVVLTVTIF